MTTIHDDNDVLGYFPPVEVTQDKDLMVQKSTPLLSLWQSPLTLAEFKILDVYLSRINSHDPSSRRVRFKKGELEELLGVKRIQLQDLDTRIQHLGIMIKVADREDGFKSIALFEEADCTVDENGLWQVDLQCTQQAMRYIFNIENLGYLRYRLRSIVRLKSRYSYLLFLYLEHHRFRHSSWEIGVDDLRNILGCTSDFYASYTQFNKNILRKCRQELLDKTTCRFQYAPIRKGRAVTRVRFFLDAIPELQNDTNDVPDDKEQVAPRTTGKDLLISALCRVGEQQSEFTEEEIAEIFAAMTCIPLYKLPANGPGCIDVNLQRYHYLLNKYTELNRRAAQQTIQNRFAYFLAMLKADFE